MRAIIVRLPEKMPPPPIPAIPLPTINTVLLRATPEVSDPIKKIAITNINTLFTEKFWYTLPQVGWNEVVVSKYVVTYQVTFDNEWKSSVMRGLELESSSWVVTMPL